MDGMSIERAALACGGELCGVNDPKRELGRVIIDSRAVQPGDLFAAFKGEKADGHDYIAAAIEKGAACCLAERLPEGVSGPVLRVRNAQTALEQIAEAYRETLSIPVVGITGSVGKTSAKEMIATVLSKRFRVLKTEGNLNNQLGVPMTLSRITKEHEAAVVEMGISGFGEMRVLSRIAKPTLGVFTVIGHAHLEYLHDLNGVLRAKTEMLENMAEDAPIVVNGDDALLRAFPCRQKKLTFGLEDGNALRAVDIAQTASGARCRIVGLGHEIAAEIPAFGKHMVYAALEGAAVGILLGMEDAEIAAGIRCFEIVGRRAAVCKTGCLTLVDDSYNANPDSVKCGVDSLLTLPGRHVCILGDMLELGEDSAQMHFDVGRYAAEQGADLVLSSGEYAAALIEGAGEKGQSFASVEALIAALPTLLQKGDAVLVKASRGARFERVSEAIKELKL